MKNRAAKNHEFVEIEIYKFFDIDNHRLQI